MKVEQFWEALKYGPLGLAAIATLLAAMLLFQVLKQPQVPKAKRQLFNTYMIFCSILVLVSIGAAVMDSLRVERGETARQLAQGQKQQLEEMTRRYQLVATEFAELTKSMDNIRMAVARLDENEMEKLRLLQGQRPEVTDAFRPVIRGMC